MIFKVFGVYLSEFLIFLREIFFGSKILSSCCDKHQNFDIRCSGQIVLAPNPPPGSPEVIGKLCEVKKGRALDDEVKKGRGTEK